MRRHPRSVDEAIARFDDLVARMDGRAPKPSGITRRRYERRIRNVAKRLTNIGVAVSALVLAVVAFGLLVRPIGIAGLFLVAMMMLAMLVFFSVWPSEPKHIQFNEQLPTKQLFQQIESFLSRERRALPAPVAKRIDVISNQLPLLESRLAERDLLDPLAQDARRLLGKHLPELIERYERVPPAYRNEQDGEGMTVNERLVAGLDAARHALDDIGAQLTKLDRDAFETQGRFIESRYKGDASFKGE